MRPAEGSSENLAADSAKVFLQPVEIETQLMQHGGVQIRDMVAVFYGVEAQCIRGTLHAFTRQRVAGTIVQVPSSGLTRRASASKA